ncbi:unnamed protein product [Cylicocyclus nassatus]|uniref:SCP domain-containing protein n=1 Tax=Cylicocyclus nassatus TaxID=53992 RepID=A0AA36H5E3_CYLNA|nr:unnamed protein product [Cylicocyclus nassatus]
MQSNIVTYAVLFISTGILCSGDKSNFFENSTLTSDTELILAVANQTDGEEIISDTNATIRTIHINTTPISTTSTRAPTLAELPWPRPDCADGNLTNDQRGIFLDMHNYYRASLVRGQAVVNPGSGLAPSAALMYRMKYDCTAESYAQKAVSNCSSIPMPERDLGGHKQNIHVLSTVQTTVEGAIQNAVLTWWSELARFGFRSNMVFFPSDRVEKANVTSWSKMSWWGNQRLGCAVQHCNNYYLTSCMYSPGGNNDYSYVYPIGAVCSDCPVGSCDSQLLCRWESDR